MNVTPGTTSPTQITLREEATCLHCWSKFRPEDALWVAEHGDLVGDPRLGEEAAIRFLPDRFDVSGNAIDAHDQPCRDVACPSCHLTLPRSIFQRVPVFISLLGAPGCGKSFFLAAMVRTLRRDFPQLFNLQFTDADTQSNQPLIRYEENLFLSDTPDIAQPLADLIPKTQLSSEFYQSVLYGKTTVSYARPLSFNLQPDRNHPGQGSPQLRSLVCLYDNAGEHFEPGRDRRETPGTRHLARSRFLIFLHDPTQDARWRQAARDYQLVIPHGNHASSGGNGSIVKSSIRQESVLAEAAQRIRSLTNLPDGQKYSKPLIIVLNKVDVWRRMLGSTPVNLPLLKSQSGTWSLHWRTVKTISDFLRKMLVSSIPELVYTAEEFADTVYYLPASSLGTVPHINEQGVATIKPSQISPTFVSIPMLVGLALTTQGLIPLSGTSTQSKPKDTPSIHKLEPTQNEKQACRNAGINRNAGGDAV